jgi:probable rRNA maturation factor
MTLPVRTTVIRNAHPRLRLDRRAISAAIAVLDAQAARFQGGCPSGELSIVLLTDPALAKIHAAFMDDPTATDVITFAGDPLAGLAGEICVSADTARAYARKHQRDFSSELTLYLVHGWLHLAGYEDLQPARKRRMRAAENRAMTLLRRQKALPVFRFV